MNENVYTAQKRKEKKKKKEKEKKEKRKRKKSVFTSARYTQCIHVGVSSFN